MNILLGEENAKSVDEKYIVLELDLIKFPGIPEPVTAYSLIEKINLDDVIGGTNWQELHAKLIENYRKRNWKYCQDAIEHLRGHWNGEIDSYYDNLNNRVTALLENDPGPDWDCCIEKS
jgi:hypothetical protein